MYSGQIKAFWDPAKAMIKDTPKTLASTKADSYIIELRQVNKSKVLEKTTIKGSTFIHHFGGIEIDAEYVVNLICVFGKKQFACGSSNVHSQIPLIVQEQQFSANVLVQSRIPRSWQDMEYLCKSSDGHLVSLDSKALEDEIAAQTSLEDYWCGGNMCKNSPAPPHSMWSDGSPQLNTNFAPDSGLDGTHCCIKVEKSGNMSTWKGESCKTMLQGICEFTVEEYLDTPSDVYGQGLSPHAVNLSWSTDALYWQPSVYIIEYCHKESLSKAALPIIGDKCKKMNITGQRGRHLEIIDNLEPFSEYKFTVIGTLDPFQKQTSTVAQARTMPKNDIEWMISSSGVLTISWLKKIADYKENEEVKLELNLVGHNDTQMVKGTAKGVTVKSLRFGASYEAKLIDSVTGKVATQFQFIACKYD